MNSQTAPFHYKHISVMTEEICNALANVPPGVILDATVGGGGHTEAILESREDLTVIGIDRDQNAIAATTARLAKHKERCSFRQSDFLEFEDVLNDFGVEALSGFIFDLGVSSTQLDLAERGFSYQQPGPLDMRMNENQSLTADQVINEYPELELFQILKNYGDERFARRIATSIRKNRPIADTVHLAEIVKSAIPARARRTGGHPAKRSFQAIRIEVNNELEQLSKTLGAAISWLVPDGRGAVLSYHSGEDQIVKQTFRDSESGGCTCPQKLPCVCLAKPTGKILNKKVITPEETEIVANRRSSSARLRLIQRLPTNSDDSQ